MKLSLKEYLEKNHYDEIWAHVESFFCSDFSVKESYSRCSVVNYELDNLEIKMSMLMALLRIESVVK